MRTRILRPLVLVLLAAALCVTGTQTADAQGNPDRRRSTIKVPPPTEKGNWVGTWFYVSRDARFALWFREDDKGLPEIKVQYFGMQNAEAFVTDWTGRAEYYVRDVPATFSLKLTERGADVIKGDWSWFVEQGSTARTENARVTLHRTGDGRRMVLVFDDLNLVVRRGTDVQRTNTRLSYTFAKMSSRLVRWQELPF